MLFAMLCKILHQTAQKITLRVQKIHIFKHEAFRMLAITIRLEGQMEQKFLRIKEVYGTKNNTEVVRYLIAEKARELEKETPLDR